MSLAARATVLAVRAYQWTVSPVLPASCRYSPSCSQYAVEAITTHGWVRGIGLAVSRLARCHPFNPGGYDPPPIPRRKD